VQGVSYGTGHRRKGRHEFRYAAYSGSVPTGRIFVTFSVGDFTKDSRENSATVVAFITKVISVPVVTVLGKINVDLVFTLVTKATNVHVRLSL